MRLAHVLGATTMPIDLGKIRRALEMARDFHQHDSKMYATISDALTNLRATPPAPSSPPGMREALEKIEKIISDHERILCLPDAKTIKQIWEITRCALTTPPSPELAASPLGGECVPAATPNEVELLRDGANRAVDDAYALAEENRQLVALIDQLRTFVRQVANCEMSDNQNIKRAKELVAALPPQEGK